MILISIVMGEKIQDSYNIGAEIFMVQTLGFTKGGINYPDWYISVLFWGSIIFYFVNFRGEVFIRICRKNIFRKRIITI